MHKTLYFLVFCVEEYKNAHGLSGAEVVQMFDRYGVFSYLQDGYEALHTMGTKYIMDDIDDFMQNR